MSLPIKIELPEGFLDEEVRCGYTVTTEMKKVWAVELDLLVQLQNICKKYGIGYFADGGTLLGAIRHKGYIPWDDDIDVAMLRKDYEKFISVAQLELEHPYFLQTPFTDEHYFRRHIQIRNSETTGILNDEMDAKLPFNQGIFIDILPLDNLPNSRFQLRLESIKLKLLNRLIRIVVKKEYKSKLKSFISRVLKLLTLPIGNDRIINHYDAICKKYNKLSTKGVGYISFSMGKERNNWNNEWYRESFDLPFELLTLPSPIGYDALLKKTYGDYMKFQPNTSSHGDIFFDVEKPYTFYTEK